MSENTAKGSNVVIMKDGRSVDFGLRGKLKKSVEILGAGAERIIKLTIDAVNGDTHVVQLGSNDPLFFELAAHGLSQKITDAVTKAEDGEDISFGVANQISQIANGVWSQRSTGDAMVRGFADLYEAIRRIKGYEVGTEAAEMLKKNLAAKSEDEIKNYKSNPQIKAILADIAAEKAAVRAAKLAAATPLAATADDLVDL